MTKEELKVLVEELRVKANEENENNVNKIKNLLQSATKFPLRIYANIKEYGYIHVSVNFVKPDGKDDFGSDFTIYFYKKGYSTNHEGLELSSGTIGSYDKHAIYQIERIKVIDYIWANIEAIEKFFESISCPIGIVCREKAYELEEIEREERRTIENARRKEIEDQFTIGKKFHEDRWNYEIVKITPKRVYYASYNSFYKKYLNHNQFFDKEALISSFLRERNNFEFGEVISNDESE